MSRRQSGQEQATAVWSEATETKRARPTCAPSPMQQGLKAVGHEQSPAVWSAATKNKKGEADLRAEPDATRAEGSRGKNKRRRCGAKRQQQKTHRFPCQGAYAPNRWAIFFAARYCSYLG